MDIDFYFDLTSGNISEMLIEKSDVFNCVLKDKKGKIYKGFLFSRSKGGKAITVCDLNFQKSATDNKYQPRLIFRRTDENLKDKKLRENYDAIIISLKSGQEGYREFWKMIGFLHKFKDLVDVGDFESSYKVVDSDAFIVELKTKEEAEKIKQLGDIFLKGNVDEETVRHALGDKRKETLEVFRKLLEIKDFWQAYENEYKTEIKGRGEEAVWHHFLDKNRWILGLNANVCFIRDLISQVEVGKEDTTGSGSPKADILGISDYTELVELKTPNTLIFTEKRETTSRANTWSFSSEFIDGISQCLGQKFDWDKSHNSKDLVNPENKVIDQIKIRTVDPRSLFIIGDKSKEFSDESTEIDILTKRDTLERFSRNSRNTDIMSFDELYERAYFSIYNEIPKSLTYASDELKEKKDEVVEEIIDEDSPF